MYTKKVLLSLGLVSLLGLGACSNPPDAPAKENPLSTTEEGSKQTQLTSSKENEKESRMVQVKESDLKELKNDIESKEEYISSMEKELKYYKEYAQSISNTMPDDKLQILIDKEWTYSLSINGVNFPTNGILDLASSDFELILKEEKAPYSVLSEEQQAAGRIKQNLSNSISTSTGELKLQETDLVQEVIVSYSKLEKGTIINIQVHEDLQKKLGLTTDKLVINIK